MKLSAAIANSLWGLANVPACLRFRRALPEPGVAQRHRLRRHLEANVNTVTDGSQGGHLKGYVNIPITDQAAWFDLRVSVKKK